VPIDETAPGELELVRTFVNTAHLGAKTEDLDEPAALRSWLGERGLIDPQLALDSGDLARAIALREALRDLAGANSGDPVPPPSLDALRAAAARAPLRFALADDGRMHVEPGVGGVDGAFARLLAIVHGAMHHGEWERLKACRDPGCRWLYYDRSKNRSGAWCDMASCGNRAKARRRRARMP
jgi:predicted RNA-binding Zn ribbon-like protein